MWLNLLNALTPLPDPGQTVIIRQALIATERLMDSSLLNLLQTTQPLAARGRLPAPLLQGEVLEARVLSNTLLKSDHPTAQPRYQVQLQLPGQRLQIIAKELLPTAQTIRLALDSTGTLRWAPAQAQSIDRPPPVSPAPARTQPESPAAPPPRQLEALQQLARQLLPQQQPVRDLIPVLQRWLATTSPQPQAGPISSPPTLRATPALGQPAPIVPESPIKGAARATTTAPIQPNDPTPTLQSVARHWLANLPSPEQLSDAEGLRQALTGSGLFTESQWRQVTADTGAQPQPQTDQKSLLLQLLNLLQRPSNNAREASSKTTPAPQPQQPIPPQTPPVRATVTTNTNTGEGGDISRAESDALLRQVTATIARTQLHQLDSLGARQSHTGDTQQANAAWVFELPVRDGDQYSNLELRIQKRDARRHEKLISRWNVDLRLDLHEYGRFSAQLTLLEKQVSATLWAERATTHQKVREHVSQLRHSLEAIGVDVRRLECRLGTPPEPQPVFRRQLVDLRT